MGDFYNEDNNYGLDNSDENGNGNSDRYQRSSHRQPRGDKSEFFEQQSYNQSEVNVDQYKNDESGDELSTPIDSFEDMDLGEKILRGVSAYGFDKPSPIQQKAIRPFVAGRDIIAQAQSGMGKTATFCIGILGRLDTSANKTQAIVLAHTRELASQIDMVFRQLGSYTDTRFNLSIGGIRVEDNIKELRNKRKPHVIVGTPGRVMDMIGKRILPMDNITMLVIDEADEMLSGKFQEQIRKVVKAIPSDSQIGLYSATMNSEFFEVANMFMTNPVNVLVKSEQLTLDGIRQYYINVGEQSNKFITLCDIYKVMRLNQIIIYCNDKNSVDKLTSDLKDNHFMVSSTHGRMPPQEREQTMLDFRKGETRVLVSTDLTSRGIDIQQVSVVINYDVPNRLESYLHRIGRCGRFGRKGVAINFMTQRDKSKMQNIERYYHTIIEALPENVAGILEI
jgi:translation initiation factor 4A